MSADEMAKRAREVTSRWYDSHGTFLNDRCLRALDDAIAEALRAVRASGIEMALEPGVAEIAAERRRQREVEGWTEAHDDNHAAGEMARAAACYVLSSLGMARKDKVGTLWPWWPHWWKPHTRMRDLERAGALIAAEIARIKRSLSPAPGKGEQT